MSEMAPEQTGGAGGIMTRRFFGIPVLVWVVIAILVIYFLFFRNKSQQSTGIKTGGGGGAATENVKLAKGAVTIEVTNPQPKSKPHERRKQHHLFIPPNPSITKHRKKKKEPGK